MYLRPYFQDSKRVQSATFTEFCLRWRGCANSYLCPHLVRITKVCKGKFARICLELHSRANT